MFKNLIVYRYTESWQPSLEQLEDGLDKARFAPCGATQALSMGWVEPRGIAHGPLVEDIGGHWLLKLMVEQRVLPGAVVRRRVEELAEKIEQETGRKPGKKAQRDLKEQVTQELLPQAFTKQSSLKIWIHPAQGLLMIDASSPARADEVVTLLVQAFEGLSLQLVQTAESPAVCMAAWLMDGVPPAGFSIDRECELKSGDEMKSVVRYARHALDIDEVRQHLQSGKAPTRLALTWRDRISFMLTDTLQIKKIAFLDVVFEGRDKPSKDEAFDADAAIATIELGQLIPDLIEGLGGEHDFLNAALQGGDEKVLQAAATVAAAAETAQALDSAPWD